MFSLFTSISVAASSSNTDFSGKPSLSGKNIVRYTFSWPYADGSEMTPRGGNTKGPEVQFSDAPAKRFLNLQVDGLTDKTRDRLAIISMAGDYRTSFDFIETMGFVPDYKTPKP